jgi:hypothetical protein
MRRLALLVGMVFALVAAAFAGNYLGRTQTEQKLSEAPDLEQRYSEAIARITELEQSLADRSLAVTVDSDAEVQLRATIKELRDQLADRREELRFYRQLMAPSQAQRGLRIERLDLIGGGGGRVVEYRLMLTQVVDRHDWVKGTLSVEIQGTEGESQRVLSLTDLATVDAYPLPFRFRYFQDFSGTLTLPDGLTPDRVVVTATTPGKDAKRVQRTFAWTVKEG